MAVRYLLFSLVLTPATLRAESLEFRVSFTPSVSKTPFSGRVFVLLSTQTMPNRPAEPKWINTEPFFAIDVQNWNPGDKLTFGADAISFPKRLAQINPGTYSIMAVMDFDRGGRSPVASDGNAFSKPIRRKLDPKTSGSVALVIDQTYTGTAFRESADVKLVDIPSPLLTKYHGKPMRLRAGVLLPKSFAKKPQQRYPIVYNIPGFSGTHHHILRAKARNATDVAGVEMLYVVLDPSCRLGHHVFADSENNGPVGQALIDELIPYIEKKYRAIGKPSARFVTGHSSGGWSSLWLQVAYPECFGGAWSTAPDPVDFRDFQRVDIYPPGVNLFTDENNKPRPLARINGKVILVYKTFSDLEFALGRGGQLGSFEAVFSPRGPDGKPMPLWNRRTGAIDSAVAKSWQCYDIRLILQRNWKQLAPKLKGKIHVYMGADDNYYLDGAIRLLKKSLAKLGSDAVIEIFPGRDHRTLMTNEMRQRIASEMAKQFRRGTGASNQ